MIVTGKVKRTLTVQNITRFLLVKLLKHNQNYYLKTSDKGL